jgi:hypothetical protein
MTFSILLFAPFFLPLYSIILEFQVLTKPMAMMVAFLLNVLIIVSVFFEFERIANRKFVKAGDRFATGCFWMLVASFIVVVYLLFFVFIGG